MSEKYAPKHRNAPVKPARPARPARTGRTGRRNAAVLSGVAVVATGFAVSAGMLADSSTPLDNAAAAIGSTETQAAAALSPEELAEREQRVSRSSERAAGTDRTKLASLAEASGVALTGSEDLTVADPKTLARALMPAYGLSSSEFGCLDDLWTSESNWNVHADNPSSSAYGIPQALPGSKMSSAGADWEDNAETQIRWGLGYIKDRYGSACSAWSFKQGNNWY